MLLDSSSVSKRGTTHCQTLGEVPDFFKSPFVMFGEIKFPMVYSIMMVKQYIEKAPGVLPDTSYRLKALIGSNVIVCVCMCV